MADLYAAQGNSGKPHLAYAEVAKMLDEDEQGGLRHSKILGVSRQGYAASTCLKVNALIIIDFFLLHFIGRRA